MMRLMCLRQRSPDMIPPDVEDLTDDYLDDWAALLIMDSERVRAAQKQVAKRRTR